MKNLYLCGSGFLAKAFIENRDMFKVNEILVRQLSRDFTYAYLDAKLDSTVIGLLENDMDLIVNLSGPTNIQDSFVNPSLYLHGPLRQVKAHMKMLEKFRKKITYVYLSSASVYGNVQNRVSESSPVNPESPYAQGKYNVEKLLLLSDFVPSNVSVVVLRATSVYDENLSQRILYLLKNALSKNLTLELFGTGEETRDFLHSRDLCSFVSVIANRKLDSQELFNVGSGESITIREVLTLGIQKYPNFHGSISFNSIPRKGDPTNMKVNTDKLSLLEEFKLLPPREGLGRYFEKR